MDRPHRPALGLALVSGLGLLGCPDDSGSGITALRPDVQVPAQLDFGEQPLGTERILALELRNTGDGPWIVDRIEPAGDAITDTYRFEVETAGFEVLPGALRSVPVRFIPLAPQEQSERSGLTIISNLAAPSEIRLVGRGVGSRLEVQPEVVDFGEVLWGSERELDVEVINRHDVAAGLFVRLDDGGRPRVETVDGAGRFELLSRVDAAREGALLPAGSLLAPDAAFTARLRYVATPGDNRRLDQGRWWLSTCAPAVCAFAAPLRARPRPDAFECAPAALDFGRLEPDERAVVETTCTNVVHEPVDLVEVRLATGPEGFEVIDAPPVLRLAPGEQFTVQVAFSPPPESVGRSLQRTLQLRHRRSADFNDDLVSTVELEGTAGRPRLEVQPSRLQFSPTAIGTYAWRTLRLANTGQGALSIRSQEATESFEVDQGSLSVPPRSFVDIEVRFDPLTVGTKQGQLEIVSNDPVTATVAVSLQGEAVLVPPCTYAISPANLQFGAVEVGRSARASVSVTNRGGGDCLLNDVAVVGPAAAAFDILDARVTGRVIAAGTSTTVSVQMIATAEAPYAADLEFYLSAPDGERVTLAITGQGVRAGLVVHPPSVRVGPTHADCAAPSTPAWIINPAPVPVTVSGVGLDAPNFIVTGIPEPFPAAGIRLAAGGTLELQVRLQGGVAGPPMARLRVDVDGLAEPYLVPIERLEATDGRRSVTFEVGPRALDVLFVVADTAAFAEEQATLPSIAEAFVDGLDRSGIDYQLGVLRALSVDPSCPQPRTASRPASTLVGACGYLADGGAAVGSQPDWRVITPSTLPSPASALSGLLVQSTRPGFGRPDVIDPIWWALTPPNVQGWNSAFRRPDAALAVVFITEQDDGGGALSPPALARWLSVVAGGDPRLTVSGAAGPAFGNCFAGGLLGRPSPRLVGLSDQTGGLALEICSPTWGLELLQGGLPILGHRRRFPLPTTPRTDSVRVFVDGAPVSSAGGSTWSVQGDLVEFSSGAVPQPAGSVEIDYRPACP